MAPRPDLEEFKLVRELQFHKEAHFHHVSGCHFSLVRHLGDTAFIITSSIFPQKPFSSPRPSKQSSKSHFSIQGRVAALCGEALSPRTRITATLKIPLLFTYNRVHAREGETQSGAVALTTALTCAFRHSTAPPSMTSGSSFFGNA